MTGLTHEEGERRKEEGCSDFLEGIGETRKRKKTELKNMLELDLIFVQIDCNIFTYYHFEDQFLPLLKQSGSHFPL